MEPKPRTLKDEVGRVYGKADMMTTAHSILFSFYDRVSLVYDFVNVAFSTWLCAMVFVDPVMAKKISPIDDDRLWLGCLAIVSFVMSIMDLRLNFKSKRDLHMRAVEFFSKMKIRARTILSDGISLDESELKMFLEEYKISAPEQVIIPDSKFNSLKKRHLMKVLVSKHLDEHPGASIILFKLRVWLRDSTCQEIEDPSDSSSGGL
jgi:hypothetical protein